MVQQSILNLKPEFLQNDISEMFVCSVKIYAQAGILYSQFIEYKILFALD